MAKKIEDRSTTELPHETPAPPVESPAQADAAEPKESDAAATERLKADVLQALLAENTALFTLNSAKADAANAEHALCEHLHKVCGSLKGVEVEIAGVRYKPKHIEKTGRYRLDRVLLRAI